MLNAIAANYNAILMSGAALEDDPEYDNSRALARHLKLTWTYRTKAGYSVQVYKLPAEKISQARILQDPVGLMKAVVDANSGVLLGMDLFCEDAQELVNTVKLVMDARIPASVLQSAVFKIGRAHV